MTELTKELKVVALLTGRGGSTLKDKNILQVCGHPLLYYPANAARMSTCIADFYVSSDDDKILNAAHGLGYKKIKRPPEFSRPDSQHIDVLTHAIQVMQSEGVTPDIMVVLLANAVTIKTSWINECVQILLAHSDASSIVPVILDLDNHPFRAKMIGKEGWLEPFFDFKGLSISTNRQDLVPSYFIVHNFWVLRVSCILDSKKGQPPWAFMGNKIMPYIVDEAIDVHDMQDIKRAENWVKNSYK